MQIIVNASTKLNNVIGVELVSTCLNYGGPHMQTWEKPLTALTWFADISLKSADVSGK